MSAFDYFKMVVTEKYADFNGRARRSEYWYFVLFNVLFSIAVGIIDGMMGTQMLGIILSLALLIPSIAVGTRRLHDTNRSGWWWLIGLVPLLGAIALLVFFAQEGTIGTNQFGPDPKNPSLAMEDDISRHLVD